jgi:hypothetical protein
MGSEKPRVLERVGRLFRGQESDPVAEKQAKPKRKGKIEANTVEQAEKKGKLLSRSPRYTDQDRERGLVALALTSGNTRAAARTLTEQGLRVSHQTLGNWSKRNGGEEYERVRAQVLPRVRAYAAEKHMALADSMVELAGEMGKRLKLEHQDMPIRDVAGAIRNVSTAAGISTDKARDLRGDPTAVVEHRSIEDVRRALRAKGWDIEGEAVDVSADESPQIGVRRRR